MLATTLHTLTKLKNRLPLALLLEIETEKDQVR